MYISEQVVRCPSTCPSSRPRLELHIHARLLDHMLGPGSEQENESARFSELLASDRGRLCKPADLRAREMGLKTATFKNASGLHHPEHKMTARELALLAEYIIRKYPQYYGYYRQPAFTWNNIAQQNRNPLLTEYPGADGLKTGFVKESGYGMVGSAVRNERRLIIVVAGLKSAGERREEAQKLLDWGFRQFKPYIAFRRRGGRRPGSHMGRDGWRSCAGDQSRCQAFALRRREQAHQSRDGLQGATHRTNQEGYGTRQGAVHNSRQDDSRHAALRQPGRRRHR